MKSPKIAKSEQAVIDQVEKCPGDNTSAMVWRRLGGGFSEGLAVGTINNVTPADLTVAMNIPARVSALARLGKLARRKGAKCRLTDSAANGSDDGYWLPGSPFSVAHKGEQVPVKQGEAKATVKASTIKQSRVELDALLEQ